MRLIAQSAAFLLLPLGLYLFLIFGLPVDFFSFRVWEAVESNPTFSPHRPFYPGMRISRSEQGDLAHHTKFARQRDVYWETDANGFRTTRSTAEEPKVFIVGDSATLGSGLSQPQTLASEAARLLKKIVYPYAPRSVPQLLEDRRFKLQPGSIVVFAPSERNLWWQRLPLELDPVLRRLRFNLEDWQNRSPLFSQVCVALDRIFKGAPVLFARAATRRAVIKAFFGAQGFPAFTVEGKHEWFFLWDDIHAPLPTQQDFADIEHKILSYKEAVEKQGAKFVFMPIPEKGTILHRHLPAHVPARSASVLAELQDRIARKGVLSVDLLTPFMRQTNTGEVLYQIDDSHWSSAGVKIAAQELKHLLEEEFASNDR